MPTDSDDSFDDEDFVFVEKKRSGAETAAPSKRRRTVHEKERDARVEAVLASSNLTARDLPGAPPSAVPQGSVSVPSDPQGIAAAAASPYEDDRPRRRFGRYGSSAPMTKADINRRNNFHLTRNALLEVDPSSKELMQVSYTPGVGALGSIPQYRSTNRMADGRTYGRGGAGGWRDDGARGMRGRGRGGGYPYRGGWSNDNGAPGRPAWKRDREG